MLGGEGKLEASRRSSVEPGCCFSRYVRGMIIEDQLDRGAGRISGVETLEEFDELPAAVAVSHASDTNQALASGVMTGSLPGRGRSSRAASGPSTSARSTQRCTV